MSREEDGFLGRWSRMKRAGDVAPAEPSPPEEAAPEPEPPAAAPEETDAEILARLDLPDPDLLQPGDEFARYLRAPLPPHLKRRAMRRLWRSNPVLANLDGLNDYDTDFTGDSVPAGTLKTAWEIGRGFVGKAQDAGLPDAPADDAPAAPPEALPEETAAQDLAEIPDRSESAEEEHDHAQPRTLRRMAFRFDG